MGQRRKSPKGNRIEAGTLTELTQQTVDTVRSLSRDLQYANFALQRALTPPPVPPAPAKPEGDR